MDTAVMDNPDLEIADDLSRFYADFYGYVMWAYPWGEEGTLLADETGPYPWQKEVMDVVSEAVLERKFDGKTAVDPIEISVSSGHGIGKSALTAWSIQWILDTRPYADGVVTANTGEQLRSKTWAQMAFWHNLNQTRDEWKLTSASVMKYERIGVDKWQCRALTWKEEQSEAFAGLHAKFSTPFYIFDEASGIPESIYQVSDGGMTDGEPMRFKFGNPTRNTGRFRDDFREADTNDVHTFKIDSRSVEGATNPNLLEKWRKAYGEDSDFFRIRVRGEFPRAASTQFISEEWVEHAATCPLVEDLDAPVILGVDVARFGDCQSVIYTRVGRDGRSFPPKKYRGLSTVQLVNEIINTINEFHIIGRYVDAVIVEGAGVGGPVVDMLRAAGINVFEINPGGAASNSTDYRNIRAEMYGRTRDWLYAGGCIPDDKELKQELIGIEYGFNDKSQIQLERKEDMQKRGVASPDVADALALTHAIQITSAAQRNVRNAAQAGRQVGKKKYHPFNKFNKDR